MLNLYIAFSGPTYREYFGFIFLFPPPKVYKFLQIISLCVDLHQLRSCEPWSQLFKKPPNALTHIAVRTLSLSLFLSLKAKPQRMNNIINTHIHKQTENKFPPSHSLGCQGAFASYTERRPKTYPLSGPFIHYSAGTSQIG
jgi:hypothetical protein